MQPPVSFGRHRPAGHTLVHLSDTHLLAGGALLGGTIDCARGLERALAAVERTDIRPDAVVISGDLTDLGQPDAYRALRAVAEPFAERLGAPIVWVAGNHDERPVLRAELLDAEATQEPITGVWDLGGLRLIALDTTVPGWHHGDLDDAQLAWLDAVLAEPAPHGTVLAMHHPPLPSHVPLHDILELQNQPRLAAVIEGRDVRAILAGHLHYSTFGTFSGIPVSVASATCYAMNLQRQPSEVNGMDAGHAFSLVHVYDDTVTHTVVPVDEGATGNVFTEAWLREMAARTPQERLEAFSRKHS